MAPLIDLTFLRKICYNDEALMREMMVEWMHDAREKLRVIDERHQKQDWNLLFNSVHQLKTNFTMLHCGEAIRESDRLLQLLESGFPVTKDDVRWLNDMVGRIAMQLKMNHSLSESSMEDPMAGVALN